MSGSSHRWQQPHSHSAPPSADDTQLGRPDAAASCRSPSPSHPRPPCGSVALQQPAPSGPNAPGPRRHRHGAQCNTSPTTDAPTAKTTKGVRRLAPVRESRSEPTNDIPATGGFEVAWGFRRVKSGKAARPAGCDVPALLSGSICQKSRYRLSERVLNKLTAASSLTYPDNQGYGLGTHSATSSSAACRSI